MKYLVLSLALAASTLPTLARAQVGVSIGIHQPGLYGRIDIGQAPEPPQLVFPQPVVVVPGPIAVQRQPIYLHVPPGHEREWVRHCHEYSACGQPVYFVHEDWYQRHYRHDRDEDHDRDHWHGRGHDHDHDRGHGHDRDDDRRDRHDR